MYIVVFDVALHLMHRALFLIELEFKNTYIYVYIYVFLIINNKSFNHEKYENETELSKYVWKLKKKNSKFSITWKIISHATTKRRPSNQCNLCLEEKYQILKHNEKKLCLLLNKRFEIRACNHK